MRINHENKSMDMEVRDINYILPAYVRSYLFYSKNQPPERIIFPMFASVKVGDKDIPIEWVPPLDPVATEIAEDGKSVAEVTPAQEAALDEKDETIKGLREELAKLQPTPEFVPVPEKEVTDGLTEEQQTEEAARADLTPTPEDIIRQEQETALQGVEDEAAEKQLEIETEPPATSPAKAAFKVDPDPSHQPPPGRQPGQPPRGDIGPGQGLSDMHTRDRKDQVQTTRDLMEEPEIKEEEQVPFEKEIKRDDQGRPIVEEPKEES